MFTAEAGDKNIILNINGKEIYSDNKPIMIDNRIFVPLRLVCENMGLTPTWDGGTKQIAITGKNNGVDRTVLMQIGNKIEYIDGAEYQMDVEPVLIDSVTYIPARFIVENYNNYGVFWSRTYNTIYICKKYAPANKGVDVPDFGSMFGNSTLTFENRPYWLTYYYYDLLYNGTAEKYMTVLKDNGFVYSSAPSGKTMTNILTKNSTVIYIGEDLYNWAMFITYQQPHLIDVENDDYTDRFPNPRLE